MFVLPYNLNEKLPGWYAVMALCIILAVVFLIRASRAKAKGGPPSVSKINRGFATFFITLTITRVLFVFSDYERLNFSNETIPYQTFVLFGYLSSLIGIALIAYLVDTYMLESKRKYLTWLLVTITIANVAVIIITLTTPFIPLNIPRYVIYASTGLVFAFVIVIYFGLARQSTGKLRRNAVISMLGVLVAVVGTLLDSDMLLGAVPVFVPPIVMFAGLVVFALGQREV